MTMTNFVHKFSKTRLGREIEESWILQIGAWVLFLGLFYGLLTIALINMKPYVDLLAGVGETQWVYSIPIAGFILKRLTIGAATIGAFLIWAPIQILECLWLIIALDAKAQKAAIRNAIALTNDLETHADSKNGATRKAVKRISKIPFFFTKWASALALGAYAFDLIVGLRAYPVWKDWQAFAFWIKTFNPIWLNIDNARDLIIMLFSFELMLVLTVIVGQWLTYRKQGEA